MGKIKQIMYTAILKRKNGKEIVYHTSNVLSYIYYEIFPSIKSNFEEMVDLTPDNIINKRGFTQVEELKCEKLKFELIDYIEDNKLIYKEI